MSSNQPPWGSPPGSPPNPWGQPQQSQGGQQPQAQQPIPSGGFAGQGQQQQAQPPQGAPIPFSGQGPAPSPYAGQGPAQGAPSQYGSPPSPYGGPVPYGAPPSPYGAPNPQGAMPAPSYGGAPPASGADPYAAFANPASMVPQGSPYGAYTGPTPAVPPTGTGQPVEGWLLFLCVSLTIFVPAMMVYGVLGIFRFLSGAPPFVMLNVLLTLGMAAFSVYAGSGLWTRRRGAVKMAKIFFGARAAHSLFGGMMFMQYGFIGPLPAAGISATIPVLIFSGIWFAYLSQSIRVRDTYGSNS